MNYSFGTNYSDIERTINNLLGNKNLSSDELEFINNMKEYVVYRHGFMTSKQLNYLDGIWRKHYG